MGGSKQGVLKSSSGTLCLHSYKGRTFYYWSTIRASLSRHRMCRPPTAMQSGNIFRCADALALLSYWWLEGNGVKTWIPITSPSFGSPESILLHFLLATCKSVLLVHRFPPGPLEAIQSKAQTPRVHVPNKKVLGILVIVIRVQVVVEDMIIGDLDPWGKYNAENLSRKFWISQRSSCTCPPRLICPPSERSSYKIATWAKATLWI